MNVKQAKQLNLPLLLSRLGYDPVRVEKGGNELWYLSPFREEGEASLHVSRGHTWPWVWKDFGDIGGTVVDFAMRYHQGCNLKQALQHLETLAGSQKQPGTTPRQVETTWKQPVSSCIPSQKQPGNSSEPLLLEFLSAQAISQPAIYQYLKGRGIPPQLADHYLEEVTYLHKQTGKEYFGFGMKNEKGGYEIRAATDSYPFKSALNGRDITLFRGRKSDSQSVNLFEGMTDFLSLLVMMKTQTLMGDSIIMHSLSSFTRTVDAIRQNRYSCVNGFLDNNRAGQGATHQFQQSFPRQFVSYSDRFAPHIDLNDALCQGIRIDFQRTD